jgi:hypothetical protein
MFRKVPKLPSNSKESSILRDKIREYYQQGYSVDVIQSAFFWFSRDMIEKIVGMVHRKSRAKLPEGRKCLCGCGRTVKGRAKYKTGYCRLKASRARKSRAAYGLDDNN